MHPCPWKWTTLKKNRVFEHLWWVTYEHVGTFAKFDHMPPPNTLLTLYYKVVDHKIKDQALFPVYHKNTWTEAFFTFSNKRTAWSQTKTLSKHCCRSACSDWGKTSQNLRGTFCRSRFTVSPHQTVARPVVTDTGNNVLSLLLANKHLVIPQVFLSVLDHTFFS